MLKNSILMPQIVNGFIRITFIGYKESEMPNDFSIISGIMFSTPFHYNIGTDAIKDFYEIIYNGIGDEYEITEMNEMSYYSIIIWDETIKKAMLESETPWPSVNYQKLAIQELYVMLPSGEISISKSNSIIRKIPILEIQETGDAYMIYPKADSSEINSSPNPFLSSGEVERCTFGKTTSEYEFTPAIITFDALSSISIILIILMILRIIMTRKSSIIEAMSFTPTILFLIGCLLGSVSSFFFVIPPKSEIQCHLRLILMGYGWVFIISYQLSRALYIAKNKKGTNDKYNFKLYLLFFVPLFILETIIIIVYLILSPSK